jgi:AcrR family transcriptional regulator
MSNKRGPLTPQDFVDAAMAFVDRQGLASLSIRALGAELDVDATALYRHFPNKESLLMAMVDHMLGEAVADFNDSTGSPRERIVRLALAIRDAFARHPDVGVALVSGEGNLKNGAIISHLLLSCLKEIGLQGRDLVIHYQTLEQYVLGSCVFDFTAAPHNFEIRRSRYRMYELPEFDAVSQTAHDVERLASEAFLAGVNGLLDTCERTVGSSSTSAFSQK